ncbi:MAG: DUF2950 domain-containing protein [Phycisphaerales bacterium]|nr:DUF2950 domain-containing protein [Phycisphaerales bacterium]
MRREVHIAQLLFLMVLSGLVVAGCKTMTCGCGGGVSAGSDTPPLPPQTYAAPEDALKAFVSAATSPVESNQMEDVFGSAVKELESADKVQHANDLAALAQSVKESAKLQKKDDNTYIVLVGQNDWPFPIPLIKSTENRWYFDTAAGKQEILDRRIGENELTTIQMMKDYVEAQRTYAKVDRTGAGLPTYAQRFHSKPGQHDGLYWETAADETPSPLGPLVAEEPAGVSVSAEKPGRTPYYGYYYRVLKAQGSGAPGGAYNYVINDNMIAGFAAIAWPSQYGNTGVMTFIVNHNGKVYQKDLGPDTAKIAHKMKVYDPTGWTEVVAK